MKSQREAESGRRERKRQGENTRLDVFQKPITEAEKGIGQTGWGENLTNIRVT